VSAKGNYIPQATISPGCAQVDLGATLDPALRTLNENDAPQGMRNVGKTSDAEPIVALCSTSFEWSAQSRAMEQLGSSPPGAQSSARFMATRTGDGEVFGWLETLSQGIGEDGTELFYDPLVTKVGPVAVTVPPVRLEVEKESKEGDPRIPDPRRLLVGEVLKVTWAPKPVDPSGLDAQQKHETSIGGPRMVEVGAGGEANGTYTALLRAEAPGPETITHAWTWRGNRVSSDPLEVVVERAFPEEEVAFQLGELPRIDFMALRGLLDQVALETWPPRYLALRQAGRGLLDELVAQATALTQATDRIGTNLWQLSPETGRDNAAGAAKLGWYALEVFLSTRRYRDSDVELLLLGALPEVVRRLVAAMRTLDAASQTIGHDAGSAARFCEAALPAVEELSDVERGLPSELSFGGSQVGALGEVRRWLKDFGKLASQTDSPPWYMLVPGLNVLALPLYAPFTQSASEHSAEIVAPIIVPLLATWHMAIEPHKIPEIIMGKVEIIEKIADPKLSQEQKWKLLLSYGGKKFIDIAFTKIPKDATNLTPQPTRGGLEEWGTWLVQNKRAIGTKMVQDLLKSGSQDAVEIALGLKSPEEAIEKLPERALKSVLKQVLGEAAPDKAADPGGNWAHKAGSRVSVDQLVSLLK